jgi:hypothetical protein
MTPDAITDASRWYDDIFLPRPKTTDLKRILAAFGICTRNRMRWDSYTLCNDAGAELVKSRRRRHWRSDSIDTGLR